MEDPIQREKLIELIWFGVLQQRKILWLCSHSFRTNLYNFLNYFGKFFFNLTTKANLSMLFIWVYDSDWLKDIKGALIYQHLIVSYNIPGLMRMVFWHFGAPCTVTDQSFDHRPEIYSISFLGKLQLLYVTSTKWPNIRGGIEAIIVELHTHVD